MATLSPRAAAAIARLRSYVPPPTSWYSLPLSRRAAVLILLFADKQGDLRVVLTMRAATLKSYAGQAALPGGKTDALTESPVATARREAAEEIGLPQPSSYAPAATASTQSPASDTKDSPETPSLPYPFRIEHLCQLPTNLAKTELGVRPVVALLHATSPVDRAAQPVDAESTLIPRLDAKEVAAVFSAPLHNFLRAVDERAEHARVDGKWYKGAWTDWHESVFRMHNFYVPVLDQPVSRARRGGKAERALPSQAESGGGADSALAPLRQRSGAEQQSRSPQQQQQGGTQQPPATTTSSEEEEEVERHHPWGASPLESPRYRVFGMTARILVDCARVAYDEDPEFEHNAHFGDEAIIHKLIEVGRMDEERGRGDEFVGGDVRRSLLGRL